MMGPIKLSSLRIDSGKPLIHFDSDDHTVFLTSHDCESLIDYFNYALPILKREEERLSQINAEFDSK